ncbi:hypothetical protein AHMF7605_04540 [Adhaeribacter arboris]|uniref:Uncharacterized protein n=1 Tax=Adhaeribacter arboris TaxID=2072846 RepID=A0A2T2YBG4_9BACT|nr:hypothetical protein AHMF7605_04540 [Adhaeribacter arboris]
MEDIAVGAARAGVGFPVPRYEELRRQEQRKSSPTERPDGARRPGGKQGMVLPHQHQRREPAPMNNARLNNILCHA